MAARTVWKGSISFGLVNIPIQVFVATQKDEFSSFNQLDKKGHKIRYKKWCPVEEREVSWSEIKKGYEITKDNYVILEKQDLDNIKLKTTHTIDIKEFIDSEDFDPLFIEKNYYIGPDRGTTKKKNASPSNSKAYSLFVKILNETKKVAIGKVVFRDKEHLVALRSYQRGLVMHQLKYLDEIRPMDEVEGISNSQQLKVEDNELSLAKTLVDTLTSQQFDIGKYSDAYAKELEKIIEAKSKGQKITVEEEEKSTGTANLLEALKASISTKAKPRRQKRT
jgi:DNA end-binding protein Ku